MSFRVSAAIAVLIFCLGSATRAPGQGHTIRGKVRNSSGVNLPRVLINLESGTGALINQTVTNNEGDFVFSGLDETSYVITISAPDYNPASEHLEFVRKASSSDMGETRTLEITLIEKGGLRTTRAELTFVQNVPTEARESFDLGVKLSREGKTLESLASLQKAVSIFPDYFDARFLLANEFTKLEKFNEAIAQLDQARRINPKDDRVFQAFGTIMMRQQKFAVAARIFAEASRLNPREVQYLVSQGTALIEQGSRIDPKKSTIAADERNYAFSEAETVLNRAYELSGKKLATVHLQLARLYEKRAERARAAAELEAYLDQSPNDKKAAEFREAIKTLRGPHD